MLPREAGPRDRRRPLGTRPDGRRVRERLPGVSPAGSRGVIGWYVHHVGLGHLHRAAGREPAAPGRGHRPVLPAATGRDGRVPGSGSPRDDESAHDPTAGGQLHWAPLHDVGLRARMATLSAWIQQSQAGAPRLRTCRSRSPCWRACTAYRWSRWCCRVTGPTRLTSSATASRTHWSPPGRPAARRWSDGLPDDVGRRHRARRWTVAARGVEPAGPARTDRRASPCWRVRAAPALRPRR